MYKRTLLTFFVVTLILIASVASAQDTPSTQIARVTSTAASVNLRSGPGQDFSVIQPVSNGTEVTVIAANEDQTWLRVRLEDGTEGWISAALLVVDLTQPTPQPRVPTPAATFASSTFYVIRGNVLVDAGRYTEAVEAYTQGLALEPDDNEIYIFRGRAYIWAQQYEQAIEDFNRAIELDPDDEDAYYETGNAYMWLSQFEQAIESYDRAIELDPNTAYFYTERANAYNWLEDYEQGLDDSNRAIRLDPNVSVSYQYRGDAYVGLNEYDSAFEDYNQAITLDPRNAYAYFSRGVAYYNTKRYGKALTDFNHAIELDSSYSSFFGWRGFALIVTRGSEEEIRADLCQHMELAGNAAYPEVIDFIAERGWRC